MTLSSTIEALLYYSDAPLTVRELITLTDSTEIEVEQALHELHLDLANRGVRLLIHDGKVTLVTAPEANVAISKLRDAEEEVKNLSQASLETLTVIAYYAPITKPDLDYLRGVNCAAILRTLRVRGLIERRVQDKEHVYVLSADALRHLGITHQRDLPAYEDTRQKFADFLAARDTSPFTD
jgi:segregation and condensation protein B